MSTTEKDNKSNHTVRNIFLVSIAILIVYVTYINPLSSTKETITESNNESIETEPQALLKDSIVEFGMTFLNSPYKYGGTGNGGFDCSGFAYRVFHHFDINVPRSSIEYKNFGEEIPVEHVQKGDVLLFLSPTRNVIGHVGIVSNANGIDSEFIHAASGKQMKVIVSNLNSPGYSNRFVKAVRVLEER